MSKKIITLGHQKFWHKLVKRDQGHLSFSFWTIIFYFVDLAIFIHTITTHATSAAYLALVLTIIIHVASAGIISWFYKKHEESIDQHNINFNPREPNALKWKIFRTVSQVLCITPIFRICVSWKDHKVNHNVISEQQTYRREITPEEVNCATINKSRECVKKYFDCFHACFKTIPQCILQIYIAVGLEIPVDVDVIEFVQVFTVARIAGTFFWTIFVTSKATASLRFSTNEYLKCQQFQDYLDYDIPFELDVPQKHFYLATLIWSMTIVGSRLYGISYIMSCCTPFWVWILELLTLTFICNIIWIRASPSSRTPYENPPTGRITFFSDLMDRYINMFSFHMVRLNFSNVMVHQFCYFLSYVLVVLTIYLLNNMNYLNHREYKTGECLITMINGAYVSSFENARMLVDALCSLPETVLETVKNSVIQILNGTAVGNVSALISKVYINSSSMNLSLSFAFGSMETLEKVLNEILVTSCTKYNFKDIFLNGRVFGFLITLSLTSSILYSTIYANLARLRDLENPFQNVLRHWVTFLNKDWTEVGRSHALKVLILGIMDSEELESHNYKFKESELYDILTDYVRIKMHHLNVAEPGPTDQNFIDLHANDSDTSSTSTEKQDLNDLERCLGLLNLLKEHLSGLDLNLETIKAIDYFISSFGTCMTKMTSYRIAQTYKLLKIQQVTTTTTTTDDVDALEMTPVLINNDSEITRETEI